MSKGAEERVIEATDLSPIANLTGDDEAWLRQLARTADTNALALKLSQYGTQDVEPIVFFDERSGCWWAGRFIGEVQFQGINLRILPRFGMPQLQRWLSRIWGVRLFSTKGRYGNTRIWLWELLAKLWETRLLAAAKHGLPTIRQDEIHYGQTLRGRLQVRLTAKEFSTGRRTLVSSTRNRKVDHHIGGVIVRAFEHMRQELRQLGDERSWLTQRGVNLIEQIRASVSPREAVDAVESRVPIRYTPITESYRDAVELSRAIVRRRPLSSAVGGENDVLGSLIDMAEVWELYVYHLLRGTLGDVEVVHTGRNRDVSNCLLRSVQTGEALGRLMPDILILERNTDRLLAVIDAKYKTTKATPERPDGLQREDLYQLAAYLFAYGKPTELLNGSLVYPATQDTRQLIQLQKKNPWRFSATHRQLWFLGLPCEEIGSAELELAQGETDFIASVRATLK